MGDLTSHRKSQIALGYAYRLHKRSPQTLVFWIHAGNADKFKQGYDKIAKAINIPKENNPEALTLDSVKTWFGEQDCGR